MTEEKYNQYINDFNACYSGDGSGFAEFYDKYYDSDAVFEYIFKSFFRQISRLQKV